MINIIEFDPGLGSMTSIGGIEDGKHFLVQKNIGLNSKNEFCYNNNHFLDHFLTTKDNRAPMDLFIASPFFGDKINKRGASNFKTDDLNLCLAYISRYTPAQVLISVYGSAIPFILTDSVVTETYDGIPTNDIIVRKMNEIGYDVQNLLIDTSRYRLPQVKIISLYYCWKKADPVDPIKMPPYKKKDEDCTVGAWLVHVRNMNRTFGKKDWSKADICSKIKPGSNAARTREVSVTSGYARLRPNMQCDNLGVDFYKTSSSGWCIHPVENRPLTIEEGAFLSGLPENYLFGLENVSKKDVASMIFRSVSPIIGNKIREGLLNSIG